MSQGYAGEPGPVASRREVDQATTVRAQRGWWDLEAREYHADHGSFLGDAGFVWGPEGWTEAELNLLGTRAGDRVLEIGGGAGQCARWLQAERGVQVVSTDLSRGMLDVGAEIDRRRGIPLAMAQCDAAVLPFADESFDHVFTSYGAVPFVAASAAVMTEAHRVLRPGGTFVFSTTHPIRWAFPDVPGEDGLTAHGSYFDRTPYVEGFDDGSVTYAEHHRTLGDRVREITAAGLALVDLVEPEWPERNLQEWGGWSPTRGRVLPGTAIFVCVRPAR